MRSYEVHTPNDVDPRPPVSWRLASLPYDKLNYFELGIRHPAGVYNLSLTRIAQRFRAVLDELESVGAKFATTGDPPKLGALVDHHESLMYGLAEHLDDCKNILWSLFKSKDAARKDAAVRAFVSHTDWYRNRVGRIVNAVKHRTGRFCGVLMHHDGLHVPGYYVEAAIEPRAVGPDPTIHEGGDTAYSLHRDLKLHFVHLYFVAQHLEDAVLSIWADPLDPKYPDELGKHEREYLEIARRLRLLSDVVYFDEMPDDYPRISIRRANSPNSELELSYGPPDHPLRTFGKYTAHSAFQGDGFTTVFKIPYFGGRWRRDGA